MKEVVIVGKIVVLATFLGMAFSSASTLAAPRGPHDLSVKAPVAMKAPREGGTEVGCACSSTSELDAIRNCICYIRTLLGGNGSADVVQTCLVTLEEINAANISIIAWLKTIYAENLGYAPNCGVL